MRNLVLVLGNQLDGESALGSFIETRLEHFGQYQAAMQGQMPGVRSCNPARCLAASWPVHMHDLTPDDTSDIRRHLAASHLT
jgi:polyhydroxyalkanoate synthesis regulator protein